MKKAIFTLVFHIGMVATAIGHTVMIKNVEIAYRSEGRRETRGHSFYGNGCPSKLVDIQ